MDIVENVIETTAVINADRQLVLDEPLPIAGPTNVRVIILLPDEIGKEEKEWTHSGAANPAFAFLKEPDEDIYSRSDGKSFHDEG